MFAWILCLRESVQKLMLAGPPFSSEASADLKVLISAMMSKVHIMDSGHSQTYNAGNASADKAMSGSKNLTCSSVFLFAPCIAV